MSIFVIHHLDSDGFCSGYSAFKKFGSSAKYYSVNYGQSLPDDFINLTKDDEVYILDFTYPVSDMDRIYSEVGKFVLIDHHIGVFDQLKDKPYYTFNNDKSGCVLAWEYFIGGDMPDLFKYVQDYDLWKHEYTCTKPIHAYVDMVKEDFSSIEWCCNNIEEVLERGLIIEQYSDYVIKGMVENIEILEDDEGLPYANFVCVYPFISKAHDRILKEYSFIQYTQSYFIKGDRKFYSLRSRKQSVIDVSKIAQKFGGNGHSNSSGYIIWSE